MTVGCKNRGQVFIKALEQYPNGATAKQIAADLGVKPYRASCELGYLFFIGTLERSLADPTRQKTTAFVYRIKPKVTASPPIQWVPELRLAERLIREDVEL